MREPKRQGKSIYRAQLRDPRWQKRRLQILERDTWRCQLCATQENELHVHHRWYGPNQAPWEAPDAALITVCWSCHRKLTMDIRDPVLTRHHEFRALYAPVHIAWGGNGHWYLSREELVWQIARKYRKTRDDLMRSDYLIQKGGNQFRQMLAAQLGQEGICTEFTDNQGTHWWIDVLAIHFVAQYDLSLQTRIYCHFAEYISQSIAAEELTPTAGGNAVVYDLIIRESQQVTALAQEQKGLAREVKEVKTLVTVHEDRLNGQARELADITARLPTPPGTMCIREFVITRLHFTPTDAQTLAWGGELSRRLRQEKPGLEIKKYWDDHSKRYVNTYEVVDLEYFFLRKGLLR